MAKEPLTLSIIIPVYNDESHLKSCLESIAQQTEAPDEVIVVDNNCTDDSIQIATGFSFVTVVKEEMQGVLHARTTGFNAATSDILGRIDADTLLPSDWVKSIKERFAQKPISAISGPVGFHDVPDAVYQIGLFFDRNIRRATWYIGKKDDAVFLFGSNMAIKRHDWLRVKNELCDRKDIHEDIDIAIHMYGSGMKVIFDKNLIAETSSRRMSDPVKDMVKYLKAYKQTYTVHGINSPAITLTSAIVLSSQYGVKLLRRAYDPEQKQLSLKKFIRGADEARHNPIETYQD